MSLMESDADLMLEVLSQNKVDTSILSVSFPLFVKMAILKETKDKRQFSPESKEYVTEAVTKTYPRLHKSSPYISDKKRYGESEAQFYLVLIGLFPEYMWRIHNRNGAPHPDYYIRAARKAFEYARRDEIASNIFDWVKVLNNIKKYQWN